MLELGHSWSLMLASSFQLGENAVWCSSFSYWERGNCQDLANEVEKSPKAGVALWSGNKGHLLGEQTAQQTPASHHTSRASWFKWTSVNCRVSRGLLSNHWSTWLGVMNNLLIPALVTEASEYSWRLCHVHLMDKIALNVPNVSASVCLN